MKYVTSVNTYSGQTVNGWVTATLSVDGSFQASVYHKEQVTASLF